MLDRQIVKHVMRYRSASVIATTLVAATTVVLGFAPGTDQRHAGPSAPPVGLGGGGGPEGPTGACCGLEGICVVTTAIVCANFDGSYQGDGTLCDPACLMTIATGPSVFTEGYLAISPDPYGAWRPDAGVLTDEVYKPIFHQFMNAAFTAGTYFFSGGTARELFSTDSLAGAIPDDLSMTKAVTVGLVRSDTDGDLVDDTATSSFNLTGVAGDLDIDLVQRVKRQFSDISVLTQEYTITNNLPTPIDFTLVRVYDGDLLWDAAADFADDKVGTLTNGSPAERWVTMNDFSVFNENIFVTLSSPQGSAYVGGKRGVDPDGDGGSLAYGFGTEGHYWDAYGVPTGWRNHIAGVGYAPTNGISEAFPPGSIEPEDAHVALEIPVSLAGNATTTVTFRHTYSVTFVGPPPGACCIGTSCVVDTADACASNLGTFQGSLTECPGACQQCPWDCAGGDGDVGIVDFLALLAEWDQIDTPCDFDGGGVGIVDFLKLLANWGPCP